MRYCILLIIVLGIVSCNNTFEKAEISKRSIIEGFREAPLGYVYLNIYEDSTFRFSLTNLRSTKHFDGKAKITKDTVYFDYQDSVPKAGKIAVFKNNHLVYVRGNYLKSILLTLNELDSINQKPLLSSPKSVRKE